MSVPSTRRKALVVHLLAARADVEQLSERKSPLMLAAAAGNLEMCQKLLEARGTRDWGCAQVVR